jgi:hypothetical protein
MPSTDLNAVVRAQPSAVITPTRNCFDDARGSIVTTRVSEVTGNSFGITNLQTTELEDINTIGCFAKILPSDQFTKSAAFSESQLSLDSRAL